MRSPRPPPDIRALALVLLALLVAGCDRARPAGELDVILISIDTLRSDRLGAYGYGRDTSPALDAFAKQGQLFENAIAESPWTLPSHVTMLSGLHPSSHGATLPTLRPGEDVPLLAEILDDAGYRTVALTGGGYLDGSHGFDRGFDLFEANTRGFGATLDRATELMRGFAKDERFFLFLHTYDVHCPYHPAPEFRDLFRSPDAEFIETEGRCGNPHFNYMPHSKGQVRFISDRYDGGVREADHHLGRFLEELATEGVLDHAVVLVTSDHGEELGDHGMIGHERTLHREVLGIPLVLRAPGLPAARLASYVGLVDVTPTVLDLVGLDVPRAMEGRSLAAVARGTAPEPPSLRISELDSLAVLRSVLTPEHHYLVNRQSGTRELYLLEQDPKARTNVAKEHPDTVRELEAALERYERARKHLEAPMVEAPTDEQEERLQALGYVD